MVEEELNKRLATITDIIACLETEIAKASQGTLVVSKVKKRYMQCYAIKPGKKKRTFIKKKELAYANELAQREYYEKVYEQLKEEKHQIECFLHSYKGDCCQIIYQELPELKKPFVVPLYLPDETFIEQWYSQHPGNKNTMPIHDPHETDRGEIVRSKSEKIIADKLFHMGIPYVYEAELLLKGIGYIYPDFTILNVRTRKTKYYEHFGAMDDYEYSKKTMKKIEVYQRNGYWLGDSFFFSMEGGHRSWDTKLLEMMIQKFFM